jgi:sterol desaturase/sphingolipid hydroxylase (fatty acid hydroxylase superfamily)
MSLIHSLQSHLPAYALAVLRLGLWLLLLSALFVPLEKWWGLRRSAPAARERWHDLVYYFLSSLLPALLLALPLAMLAMAARALLPAALPAAMAALPLAARLGLAFVIGEVGFYWGHRLTHAIPLLWRFHAIHHSPQHLYFMVNTRAHPVDLIFTRLVGLAPLYVLGLAGPGIEGSVAPVSVILVATVWGFFIHANLAIRLGPLEWLLATPAFHHWHHSRRDHTNRNFASMLPLLDRLFGTHYLPSHWPAEYGIEHPLPPTLGAQLLDPLHPQKINKT